MLRRAQLPSIDEPPLTWQCHFAWLHELPSRTRPYSEAGPSFHLGPQNGRHDSLPNVNANRSKPSPVSFVLGGKSLVTTPEPVKCLFRPKAGRLCLRP